jgi:hypothetical protein
MGVVSGGVYCWPVVSVRVRDSSFGDFEDLDVLAGGRVGCRALGVAGSEESGSFQR